MKTLVLVDFDKTLYKKDSLIEFTRFYKGTFRLAIGLLAIFFYGSYVGLGSSL